MSNTTGSRSQSQNVSIDEYRDCRGGQAACTLIAELVRGQFAGKILVFNDESHRPYQRPPLSKTWLHNPTDTESIRLLPSRSKPMRRLSGSMTSGLDRTDQG